jgi:hypothetical protein
MEIPVDAPGGPRVLYEDEWVVAVHKPPRTHSAPGRGGNDLCAWAFERYPELRVSGGLPGRHSGGEGGLLHRLDYETSGLVLFARNPAAFASLMDQQAKGGFYKEYIAFSSPSPALEPLGSAPRTGFPEGVLHGNWAMAREDGDAPALTAMLRAASAEGTCGMRCAFRPFGPKGAHVACLAPETAGSRTIYSSDILAASPASGTESCIDTRTMGLRIGLSRGFRHQIRAQLAWIGLPISGDPLYGGRMDERLRLYANRLSFTHPGTGAPFSIEADA